MSTAVTGPAERDEWRRSALEAARCLFRYYHVYEAALVDESSDPNRRGRAFHAAAEGYVKKLILTKTSADLDLAREAFTDALEAELLPSHLISETEMLFFRWAEGFELDLDAVFIVEDRIKTELEGEVFTWQPDLVYARDGGIDIFDWKTHFAALTDSQSRNDFQALFYLLMAAIQWPNFRRYRFFYRYVRLGLTVPEHGVELSAEDVMGAERRILGAVTVILSARERNEWPAAAGPHCQFCQLANCPIVTNPHRMPVRVDNDDDRDELANQYIALGRRLDQIGELLKNVVTVDGPFTFNGTRFDLKQIEKSIFPMDEVLAILDAHDVEFPSDAHMSKKGLGDLVDTRKYPAVARDLLSARIPSTSFRFEARKDGEISSEPVDEDNEPASEGRLWQWGRG